MTFQSIISGKTSNYEAVSASNTSKIFDGFGDDYMWLIIKLKQSSL